jgi:hypothetical protein
VPLPVLAVYAKRPSEVTATQHAAVWPVPTEAEMRRSRA